MSLNPEFRRNLWLELTPYRLVGMPLVLFTIFFLSYLLDGRRLGEGVASTAVTLFVLLTLLWGTRLASESVVAEIRDHTWDGQRMSVLGPWDMAWGKLLGSTVYPWYGALSCLAIFALATPDRPPLEIAKLSILLVATGLLSQAVGLLASLQAIRKNRVYGRSQAAAFLVLGIVVALPVLSMAFEPAGAWQWYGRSYPGLDFLLASLLVFLAWTIVGTSCLLRAELQLRSLPLAWCGFVLFLMVYFAGFIGPWTLSGLETTAATARLMVAFGIASGLTYFMAFGERKDPIAFRRLLKAANDRQWRHCLEDAPGWLVTMPFVAVTGAALILQAAGDDFPFPVGGHVATVVAASVFFLLRDIGLLLFFNLGRSPKRADMLAVLCLALLYGVVPAIVAALGFEQATALFWPRFDLSSPVLLTAALSEALLVWWLAVRRWKVAFGS